MAFVKGASPAVASSNPDLADKLTVLEAELEPLVRSLQSFAMKGEGNESGKQLLRESVKLKRKYKKLKSSGKQKKAESILTSLIRRISALLGRGDESPDDGAGAGAGGGGETEVISELAATAKEFVPQAVKAQQLNVLPSSDGQKVVSGVSTELNADLFLDAPVELSDLDLDEEVNAVVTNTSSAAKQGRAERIKAKYSKSTKPNNKRQKKWWKSLTDSDPITMEPLSSMKYPPFELKVESTEADRPTVSHYFDGKVLAHYIVSTGNFANPNNRQELTRSECTRLDEYLRENRLPAANVTDAFDLRKICKVQTDAQSRMNTLQREASVVMRSLFQFPSRRDGPGVQAGAAARLAQESGIARQRLVNPTVYSDGSMTIIDANSWESMDESRLQSLDDFPSISGGVQPAAATSTVRAQSSWPRTNAAYVSQQEFPSLSSGVQVEQRATPPQPNFLRVASQAVQGEKRQNPPPVLLRTSSGLRPGQQQTSLSDGAAMTRVSLGRVSEYTLCPYTPDMIAQARKFGLNWVRDVQLKLSEFVLSAKQTRVMTPHFKVMSSPKRRFIQSLCSMYYGLDASTMDRDPHAWVQVVRSQNPLNCDISISQALTNWPQLFEALPASTSTQGAVSRSCCIALWGVVLNSATLASNRTIHEAMDAFARPSEYNIVWCKPEHALIEFVERKLARKIYSRLKGKTSLGGLRWHETQWWPCGTNWAVYQLDKKDSSTVVSRRREKERKQLEQVHNRLQRERQTMQTRAVNTGWDSDDDDPRAVTQAGRVSLTNKWHILDAE